MSFESFNFDRRIVSTLEKVGFTTATPIQAEAIPLVCAGDDLFGLAQTGTGKTAAFVLPMINKFSQTRSHHPRGLIVAPTRELAQQIFEVVATFGRPLGIRAMTAFGGANMHRQVNDLRRGVDIVIACPGRLLDHMDRSTVNLSKIEMLVLDEADQMFDMGFLPALKEIVRGLPKARQTLLFSATMPHDIKNLANEILKNPKTVKVGSSEPIATVAQALYPTPAHLKEALLIKILGEISAESVLVFTRTKHRAKRLAAELEKRGFNSTSLQGNLSPGRRREAMTGFRSGKYQIMVATDIAARGIDISSITHVINFDIPDTVEAYTHRIGRTGRAARNGDALTLVSPEDNSMVRAIERVLRCTLPRRSIEGFDYKVSAPPRSASSRDDFRRPRNGGGGFGGGRRRFGSGRSSDRQDSNRGGGRGGSDRRDSQRSGGNDRRDSQRSGGGRAAAY